MEGRRIEGILLDTALLRNRAHEAYETARTFQIKVLSQVPEVLLSTLGDIGSRTKAVVRSIGGQRVVLLLENGYEIEAQNKLSLPIKEGEELILKVENTSPLTLKVEQTVSKTESLRELIKMAVETLSPPLKGNLKDFLESSGLDYEKKVWNFLKGTLGWKALSLDQKYQVLRALSSPDTYQVIEKVLREIGEPSEGIKPDRNAPELFKRLLEIEKRLKLQLDVNREAINHIKQTLSEITTSVVKNLSQQVQPFNMKIVIREDRFFSLSSDPRTLKILDLALRSLEEGKAEGFKARLASIGLEVYGIPSVPDEAKKVASILRDTFKGSMAVLEKRLGTKEPAEIRKKLSNLERETALLEEKLNRLGDIPSHIKESFNKLEAIHQLQVFLMVHDGKKFLVPFKTEEGKGFLAVLKENTFKIFIKLNFSSGFLGVLVEAPRVKNPDRISVIFTTDILSLEEILRRSVKELSKELESLGLKLSKLEVLRSPEKDFDRELVESFGPESGFTLRV